MRRKLNELNVDVVTSTKVLKITDGGVVVQTDKGEETWPGFDTIVLSLGAKSRNEIARQLKGKVKEVYVIGDAMKPGKGVSAIRQGAETGLKV